MNLSELRNTLTLLENTDDRLTKVKNNLRLQTTVRVDDFSELEMWFHSPVRLAVRHTDSLLPEAWYKNGGQNLSETGFSTVQELADFLKSQGVNTRKKPAVKKSSPSVWD